MCSVSCWMLKLCEHMRNVIRLSGAVRRTLISTKTAHVARWHATGIHRCMGGSSLLALKAAHGTLLDAIRGPHPTTVTSLLAIITNVLVAHQAKILMLSTGSLPSLPLCCCRHRVFLCDTFAFSSLLLLVILHKSDQSGMT